MKATPELKNNLARNLKILRERKGFSKRYLAALAGLQQNEIHYFESGKVADPRGSTLLKLGKILKVSPMVLFAGTENQVTK